MLLYTFSPLAINWTYRPLGLLCSLGGDTSSCLYCQKSMGPTLPHNGTPPHTHTQTQTDHSPLLILLPCHHLAWGAQSPFLKLAGAIYGVTSAQLHKQSPLHQQKQNKILMSGRPYWRGTVFLSGGFKKGFHYLKVYKVQNEIAHAEVINGGQQVRPSIPWRSNRNSK